MAGVFEQKPQEISNYESLFNNIILAKRAELPPGYFERSKLVKNDYFERIYTVDNSQCSDSLFLGELFRADVQSKIQELVVFTCEKGEDGVNFIRTGEKLKALDSTSLLHLDFQSLIEQGVFQVNTGQGFFLEIKSFGLEFLFQRLNHYQKSLTLFKENLEAKVKIVFIQSIYADEVRWEFDIYYNNKNSSLMSNEVSTHKVERSARFLTISRKNLFHEDIYGHARYLNGLEVDPIEYLGQFEKVSQLIDEMSKSNSNIVVTIPTKN